MTKLILVMTNADTSYGTALSEAVTTLCDSRDEVKATILGFLSSEDNDEIVDGNMDFDDAADEIDKEMGALDEEEQIVFILGDNEDDDFPGLEILVKEL
jgi:hypothetical protein